MFETTAPEGYHAVHDLIDERNTNGLADVAANFTDRLMQDRAGAVATHIGEQLATHVGFAVDHRVMSSAVSVQCENSKPLDWPPVHPPDLSYEERSGGVANGLALMKQYAVLHSVRTGVLETIDAAQMVDEFAAEHSGGVTAQNYRLRPLGLRNGADKGYARDVANIYLDAPVGFLLEDRDKPVCYASFRLDRDGKLFVPQIQGQANVVGSRPPRWAQLLIGVAEHIASENNVNTVVVQSAENNEWSTARQMNHRYDKPALQRGYSLNERRNWEKTL